MLAVLFAFSCIMITEIQSQKAILFLVSALAYQLGMNHSKEVSHMCSYSIVVPVYQAEAYLEECIESVLRQKNMTGS